MDAQTTQTTQTTQTKVIRNWSKDFTPEERANYNAYKNAYVKARRLKNLESEKARQAAYMREYRAKKMQAVVA